MILVATEHDFPDRLRDSEVDFNLANLNGYIYTAEVPPNETYKLLTTKWGVAPNVALALINLYGGHIYDMKEALIRLHLQRERLHSLFDSNHFGNVIQCLKWEFEKAEDTVRMRDTLRQLAVTGFVPIKNIDDPVVKVISVYDVGGVVMPFGTVIGSCPDVWQQTECEFGIVPSKQSMRLIIAEILEE